MTLLLFLEFGSRMGLKTSQLNGGLGSQTRRLPINVQRLKCLPKKIDLYLRNLTAYLYALPLSPPARRSRPRRSQP